MARPTKAQIAERLASEDAAVRSAARWPGLTDWQRIFLDAWREGSDRLKALEAAGGYAYPAHQTPWQEIQRGIVSQLSTGAVLEPAISYQRLAQGGIDGKSAPVPRDNH